MLSCVLLKVRRHEELVFLSERGDAQLGKVAGWISPVIGVLLGIWALSDAPSIGGGLGFRYTQAAVLGVGILLIASSFAPLGWSKRALGGEILGCAAHPPSPTVLRRA